uniref:tRNA pseudouridine synthase B n=1 Tax=bacterium enrichment culture TaxID=207831 RepID=A0A0R7N6J4_9BACT|nr:tRNA pseudouridine synthase B [bacterium enrichment culture]
MDPRARSRPPRRRVDGVLLLDKPAGLSSNAALQRAKRLFNAEKAGHTGTLDPLASGLLPLCFGDATKFAQALLDAGKVYVAGVRFGIATSTGDAEGAVVAEAPVTFTRAELEQAMSGFVGRIAQVPPRHSALKYQGRNYYDYARAGVEIPRVARPVDVDALELLDWTPPIAQWRVACGKGTYIRTLAEDVAVALACCAHLAALRRTATGPFDLDSAIALPALEALAPAERDALLLPADAPLAGIPRLDLDRDTAARLTLGQLATVSQRADGRFRGYGPAGRFLGLVEVTGGDLRAVRLVRPPDAP